MIALASQPVPDPSSDIPRETALPPNARRRAVAALLGVAALRVVWRDVARSVATDAAEAPAAPIARSLIPLALGLAPEPSSCPARAPAPAGPPLADATTRETRP